MRRRSGAGEKPAKKRHRKTVTPKRGEQPKARPFTSQACHTESQAARLTRELQESLARENATSEVLRVISSSPRDATPVFEAILENATRICEAKFGALFLCEWFACRCVTQRAAGVCTGNVVYFRSTSLYGYWTLSKH